ncbi:hypothetical protein [Halosolutus gelatinilyticus]|uniref:hypothetical protein n=1 Tax=Halosolutus gelatinilyticus TaxID=2931975 RepID=UPI001FF1B35A|nr:hypothetical protein [Halosolutus gelatinilyticus]
MAQSLTAVGFWLGTVLPIVYVPMVLVGIDSMTRFSLFVGLLVLHALALVVGHEYDGSRSSRS